MQLSKTDTIERKSYYIGAYQLACIDLRFEYRETNDQQNDDFGFLDRVDLDGSFYG